MRRALFALAAFALCTTAVSAQNVTVIKERQAHLKKIGDASKPVGEMYKGNADFDLAKVQAALKIMQEKAAILPSLFPEDSKAGADTEALPAIWNDKADFETRYKKLGEAAKAAEASITDEETFPDTWKEVMGNCSGCHKKFRKPKT